MSIPVASEDQIFTTSIALAQAQFPQQDVSDKSFFGLMARMHAQILVLLVRAVEQADNDAVPAYKQDADGTLLSKCSSAALDAWAITYGLPSGTAGIYGRRGQTISSGGLGIPTCTVNGTVIPAGTQATDPTGQITVETTAAITTNGPPNTVVMGLRSVTTGTQANIPAGTRLSFTSPPANVASAFTLTSALVGGQDRESDGDLLARILFKIQNPLRGGTAADYRYWAESSVDANGLTNAILRAYVYPLRSGLGTVDVVALVAGQGAGRIPIAGVLLAVQAYLDRVRPVTAVVNVLTPREKELRVRVRTIPTPIYPYDFDDGGIETVVRAGSTATQIVIDNVQFRGTLRAAIDAAKKPRIQIANSTAGASIAPYVRQVTAYQIDAPAAGSTTLTLSTAMPVAPTVGNILWAAGSIVESVAARLVDFFNQLGPSRASGFADENDPWEPDVRLARIADVVMETRDQDGTRMVYDIPDLPATGVQVDSGAGFLTAGYIARDVGSPELCYLRRGGIEIVQGR